MTTVTQAQHQILQLVATHGALTSRYLNARLPRPHWQPLLDMGVLHEVHTLYGTVIGYTLKGKDSVHRHLHLYPPYLHSPSSLADRAYLNDALRAVHVRGYVPIHIQYKLRNPELPRRGDGQNTTDQVHFVVLTRSATDAGGYMNLPPLPAERTPPILPGTRTPYRGQLRLYASISGGGATPSTIRSTLKKLHNDLMGGRPPILVTVPDLTPQRALLRQLTAYQAAGDIKHHTKLTLIIQRKDGGLTMPAWCGTSPDATVYGSDDSAGMEW